MSSLEEAPLSLLSPPWRKKGANVLRARVERLERLIFCESEPDKPSSLLDAIDDWRLSDEAREDVVELGISLVRSLCPSESSRCRRSWSEWNWSRASWPKLRVLR